MARDVVLAIHDAQLAEHGGETGVRDPGLLESALFRAKNAVTYGDPSLPEVAALYALGIVKNHPFVDGNKRVGAVLLETFLEDHGCTLDADDAELISVIMSLAAGRITESNFTKWVRARTRPAQA